MVVGVTKFLLVVQAKISLYPLFMKGLITLCPAYSELVYNEHPIIRTKFTSIKVIDSGVKIPL